jgi:DUF3102 family protein
MPSERSDANVSTMVAIGERLVECRKLLKEDRVWLAWLSSEFSWSRRTANRFVDLYRARHNLGKLPSLPASALYLLAKARPAVIQVVERSVAAGERPTVGAIRMLVASERGEAPRGSFAISAPPAAPRKILDAEVLASFHALAVVHRLAAFAADISRAPAPDEVAAAVPLQQQATVRENARMVADFTQQLARASFEGPRLELVTGESEGDDETN